MIVLIISAVLFILLLYMGVFTLVHMDNQKRQETCETQLVSYECQSIEFLVGTGGICLCKREPPQDHTAVYLVRE